MSDKNKQLPYNLDAEQAVLCCMLVDNSILADVLEKLNADDFYTESHQYILSAMKMVYNERKPLDLVTLSDKLETEGNLGKCGGLDYLVTLTQIVPSAANYNHYFDIVRRDSINRKLIRVANDIIKYSKESDDSLKSVQYAEQLVYDISKTNDSSSVKDIRESSGVQDVLDKFTALDKNKNAYRGIQTGFTELDKLTNGLQKSDLIVLAARPGMGKTSLAMNIVENAALHHDKVCAVFSLEMPEIQIYQRLLCGFAGVSMKKALAGDNSLDSNDWKKLTIAANKMKSSRIFVDDSSRVTPTEILSKCRRIKAKNNGQLDLVMIDYIQLMTSARKTSDQNRTQEVADITRDLKIMAKELDVPVIALSQLRRMQTKEPQLSDLRESGSIEQDADIVMFIHRPDVNASDEEIKKNNIIKGMAYLIVAKHRNGGLDRIKLHFKGELTKFVNAERDDNIQPPEYSATNSDIPDYTPPDDDYGGDLDDDPPFED